MENVYQLIEVAKKTGKIKKGINEVTKAIERGQAKVVAVAKDVSSPEVVMHIPMLCKEKDIPYYQVGSRDELGAAAGLGRPAAAVAVINEGNAKDILKELRKGGEAEKESAKKQARKESEESAKAEDESTDEGSGNDESAEKSAKKEKPAKKDKPKKDKPVGAAKPDTAVEE